MTPEQFTYWLQGFIEVHGQYPNEHQWQVIKDHLQEVFHKKTPNYSGGILGSGIGGIATPTPGWGGSVTVPYQNPQWTTTTADPLPGNKVPSSVSHLTTLA